MIHIIITIISVLPSKRNLFLILSFIIQYFLFVCVSIYLAGSAIKVCFILYFTVLNVTGHQQSLRLSRFSRLVLVVNFKVNIKTKVVHAYKTLTLFVFVYCDEDRTSRLPSGKSDINRKL